MPRADRVEGERGVNRHGGACPTQRDHLRGALACDARGAHLVPGEAKARELEAAQQLRVFDDPGEPRVVGTEAATLQKRGEALLLRGRARLQAEGLAHLALDSKGSIMMGSGLELCSARRCTIQDLTPFPFPV